MSACVYAQTHTDTERETHTKRKPNKIHVRQPHLHVRRCDHTQLIRINMRVHLHAHVFMCTCTYMLYICIRRLYTMHTYTAIACICIRRSYIECIYICIGIPLHVYAHVDSIYATHSICILYASYL